MTYLTPKISSLHTLMLTSLKHSRVARLHVHVRARRRLAVLHALAAPRSLATALGLALLRQQYSSTAPETAVQHVMTLGLALLRQ